MSHFLTIRGLALIVIISGCSVEGSDDSDTDVVGDADADGDIDADADADIDADADGDMSVDGDSEQSVDGDVEDGPSYDPIEWGDCNDGLDIWPEAECSIVSMPLSHSVSSGSSIDVFVKRIPAQGERRRQLWILEGGPGPSAASYLEPQMAALLGELSETEVLVMDHRGSGASSLLECAPFGIYPEMDEMNACADVLSELGGKLEAYSTTQVAQDLGVLIERARAPEVPVFLYGRSYGTYLLLRYFHFYPSQVDGVILDSLCPPELEGVSPHCLGPGSDTQFDAVFREFMEGCADDSGCAERLGSDTLAYVGEVLDVLEAGTCSTMSRYGFDDIQGRLLLGSLFQLTELWPSIAPFLYRLHRCTSEDEDALLHFLRDYVPSVSPPSRESPMRRGSNVLMHTVSSSESAASGVSWPDQTTSAIAFYDTYACLGYGTIEYVGRFWPTYDVDPDVAGWPTETPPLLVLHGELDPQTPAVFGHAAQQVFVDEHQHVVMIPNEAHVIVYDNSLSDNDLCGVQLFKEFLDDPTSVDATCAEEAPDIDYSGQTLDPIAVFGTEDLWD